MRSKKRGKLFVDTKVQGALAIRIAMHWCLFFVVSMMCIFALEYFLGEPGLSFQEHASVVWRKYAFFILLMITIVPSFVYDAIKLSNRFAGPMVRLRTAMQSAADGAEVKPIKFRDGDFWMEVCDLFNKVGERLNKAEATSSSEPKPTESETV